MKPTTLLGIYGVAITGLYVRKTVEAIHWKESYSVMANMYQNLIQKTPDETLTEHIDNLEDILEFLMITEKIGKPTYLSFKAQVLPAAKSLGEALTEEKNNPSEGAK